MKRKIIIVAVIVTLILLADQLVKIYIKTNFDLGESHNLIGSWFVVEYIENQGMAFGTSFGAKMWHKLALSLFRIVAISALVYYWIKQMKKGAYGVEETKHTGFLFGNVVDMFKFHGTWPKWMPWIGGGPLFPAIWNIADASITSGVVMIFIRQKKYFPNVKKVVDE